MARVRLVIAISNTRRSTPMASARGSKAFATDHRKAMTRGEHQHIPSADTLLAAARTHAGQTKAASHITIPLPSVRAEKSATWWTLGIVLFLCATPFLLWGLSIAT